MATLDRRLSVAPMMERTDRHFRYFLRLVTRRTLLYTEMVTTGALLHGDRDRLLAFDAREQPLALQIGGSDPAAMARCARIAEERGFVEVNMNVGCPSARVRSGRFGACLMAEPGLVAECVAAMVAAVGLPVTVKTRLGIDEQDSYAELARFVDTVAAAGCRTFVVHARKAWLAGLSPRENRELPPLRHDRVLALKRDFPHLAIVLNGGVASLDEAEGHLRELDGVMIGRAAYRDPYLLAHADTRIFGDAHPAPSRREIVTALVAYARRELARGERLAHIARHVTGLYHCVPGARVWRRMLAESAHRADAAPELLLAALPRERADEDAAAAA